MITGFMQRSITERHRLLGETVDLDPSEYGPDVDNNNFPIGTFLEDN